MGLPGSARPARPVAHGTERAKVAAALLPSESPGKEASVRTFPSDLMLGRLWAPHIGGTRFIYMALTLSDTGPRRPRSTASSAAFSHSHLTRTASKGHRRVASPSLPYPVAAASPQLHILLSGELNIHTGTKVSMRNLSMVLVNYGGGTILKIKD